jgi:hypothetical protein
MAAIHHLNAGNHQKAIEHAKNAENHTRKAESLRASSGDAPKGLGRLAAAKRGGGDSEPGERRGGPPPPRPARATARPGCPAAPGVYITTPSGRKVYIKK